MMQSHQPKQKQYFKIIVALNRPISILHFFNLSCKFILELATHTAYDTRPHHDKFTVVYSELNHTSTVFFLRDRTLTSI